MWILVVIIIQSSTSWFQPQAITIPWYGFQTEAACAKAQDALEQAKQREDQTVFYRCQPEEKP